MCWIRLSTFLVPFLKRRSGPILDGLVRFGPNLSGLEANWCARITRPAFGRKQPAGYQFLTFRCNCILPQTAQIILCKTSPDLNRIAWSGLAKRFWFRSKPVCKNHWACFWPVLLSQSRSDANRMWHLYWDNSHAQNHQAHFSLFLPLWVWTQPLYWARQDIGHRRGVLTQTSRLHCLPQTAADRPSSRTSTLPTPTSLQRHHTLILAESGKGGFILVKAWHTCTVSNISVTSCMHMSQQETGYNPREKYLTASHLASTRFFKNPVVTHQTRPVSLTPCLGSFIIT